MRLHFKPAPTRHLYVENCTVHLIPGNGVEKIEKFLPGAKCLCVHAQRNDEALDRPADRWIVIHDGD